MFPEKMPMTKLRRQVGIRPENIRRLKHKTLQKPTPTEAQALRVAEKQQSKKQNRSAQKNPSGLTHPHAHLRQWEEQSSQQHYTHAKAPSLRDGDRTALIPK